MAVILVLMLLGGFLLLLLLGVGGIGAIFLFNRTSEVKDTVDESVYVDFSYDVISEPDL